MPGEVKITKSEEVKKESSKDQQADVSKTEDVKTVQGLSIQNIKVQVVDPNSPEQPAKKDKKKESS